MNSFLYKFLLFNWSNQNAVEYPIITTSLLVLRIRLCHKSFLQVTYGAFISPTSATKLKVWKRHCSQFIEIEELWRYFTVTRTQFQQRAFSSNIANVIKNFIFKMIPIAAVQLNAWKRVQLFNKNKKLFWSRIEKILFVRVQPWKPKKKIVHYAGQGDCLHPLYNYVKTSPTSV